MKIAIIGTRGIPAKYGGFETFAEELSTRLVKKGIECTVYCDLDSYKESSYKGVKLVFMPTTKTKKPLKYYYLSLKYALKDHQIVIIAGSSGALFFWIKYFVNRKAIIITNTDGIEYKRAKWSFLKQSFIHFGEWIAVHFSDYIIADSKGIKEYLKNTYTRITKSKIRVIEYGANSMISKNQKLLKDFSLIPGQYYIVVARLEPENNIEMIIKGFLKSKSKYPLIIVGNISKTKYITSLLKYQSSKVIFLGGIYDKEKLLAIRSFCKAYFHGHSVGGTNPSLLEAMAAANFIIAHDNPFNRDVTNNQALYFSNPSDCAQQIINYEGMDIEEVKGKKQAYLKRIKDYYNWDRIVNEYIKFFNQISLP